MGASSAISSVVKLGLIAAAVYVLWNWNDDTSGVGDMSAHAENSCIDEVRSRFDTTTVRSYSVKESNNGYVVRGSMTLSRGGTAKVTCLTNEHGRVIDVMVDER